MANDIPASNLFLAVFKGAQVDVTLSKLLLENLVNPQFELIISDDLVFSPRS